VKIGDLVHRKISMLSGNLRKSAVNQNTLLGSGIILSKHMAGKPKHKCVTVFYPKPGKTYDIAESLLEVISEL